MTIYICQIPHQLPAKFWTSESEEEAIRLCGSDFQEFEDIDGAIWHDQQDAYYTTDLFDLYLWVWNSDAALCANARGAFWREFAADIESVAKRIDDPDDEFEDAYTAFGGRFLWREVDAEWSLDGGVPQEAADLARALCAASRELALENMETRDV